MAIYRNSREELSARPQEIRDEGIRMFDTVIPWVCAHPLEFVGLLVAGSIAAGLMFIPRIHELPRHGPPRC
jgi:hypothetical protein